MDALRDQLKKESVAVASVLRSNEEAIVHFTALLKQLKIQAIIRIDLSLHNKQFNKKELDDSQSPVYCQNATS